MYGMVYFISAVSSLSLVVRILCVYVQSSTLPKYMTWYILSCSAINSLTLIVRSLEFLHDYGSCLGCVDQFLDFLLPGALCKGTKKDGD